MDVSETRRSFAELAAQEDDRVDLLRGALLIAQEEYPDLRVEGDVEIVERIASRLGEHLAGAEDFFHGIFAINRVLFDEMGFRGNEEAYEDPDNSMMNQVLRRRLGIPITLCVLYIEVARRVGFPVEGIGLPGHFLVRFDDDWGPTFVDPFHGGRVVLREDMEAIVRKLFGPKARLVDEHLEPVSHRQMLSRLLVNLKRLYVRRQDYRRALSASERIVLLNPDAHAERRDRGLLYRRNGKREAAIADLRGYLLDQPQAIDAQRIRRVLQDLLQQRAAEG